MNKNTFFLIAITVILFPFCAVGQTTYFVDAARPDNAGSGASWTTAKKDVQIAINLATTGDAIWVKAGTYLPTHDPFGSTTPANNRDKTFTLKNGVKVFGGFAGTETQLNQRNWETNITNLSGDLGVLNTLTDNAYHVVISVNLNNVTLLDGVTVTKGYATAPNPSSITVNTRIIDRYKGGGIYNSNSATTFTNVTIRANSADCTNTDDDAWGAGIVNDICSSSFTNCYIDSNSFLVGGASFGVFGAGMLINGGGCLINNCIFSNNTSGSGFLDASRGGALYLGGTATISNCVFYNNSAQDGAAIHGSGSSSNLSTITNCTLTNNTSPFVGVGFSGFAKATFRNCIIWNNIPTSNPVAGRSEIFSHQTNVANQTSFINCIIRDAVGSPPSVTNAVLTNCITGNPLFTNLSDGDGPDNKWATSDDGITIQSSSPAKNYGVTGAIVPTTDIVGNTRDAQPDLGAYEYVAACVIPTAYTLDGGGAYCDGGVGQVVVILSSEIGVTYQLQNNAVNVGGPVAGTGNAISFGNQTSAGNYTAVATRIAGGCFATMTGVVNISVIPNVTPTFNSVAAVCSGTSLSALPTNSTNSITGSWSPALNNAATTTYTFTPTAGQCSTTTTLTIVVNPNVTPTFTPVNAICSGAPLVALPTTSNNAIGGTWSPTLNNIATTTYTFTPTSGQCATITTLTITVNVNVIPTFTPVNPICSGATLSALPTTSNNSVTGSWSPTLNNTATTTYTFTSAAGQCATTTTLTITVNQNVTPTFTTLNPICSGATLSALPSTSSNGITGTWSPTLNNTATTTYTFTPTLGQCATMTTLTITVYPNVTPTFTPVSPICSGATLSALPTTSNNAVTGSWSPSLNNTQTTTYTFTPTSGQCANTTSLTITVSPNSINTVAVTACNVYTWSNNGQTYTTSGTYTGATIDCITQQLELTINNSTTNGSTTVINSGPYTWTSPFGTGQTYSASGVYTHTTTNAAGCPNDATLIFTISPFVNTFTIGTSCGATVNNLAVTIVAGYVVGAIGYTFRVTNMVNNTVLIINRPVNSFALSNYASITLGTQYQIEVSTNGGATFGAPCTVFTPAPTSTIGAQCGTTLTSMGQWIIATYRPTVTAYRFRLINQSSGTTLVYDALNGLNKFNFNQLPTSFRMAGTTYSVEVALRNTNGSYLPYGTSCNITTPGTVPSRVVSPDGHFVIVLYPNPYVESFGFDIKNTSQSRIQFRVYNMLGKQIENKIIDAAVINDLKFGSDYPSGVYNVILSQDGNTKTLRLIKR